MKHFAKPRIVVSRCIEFEPVRHDGTMIKSDIVVALKPYAEFITVCPEVELGLSVPRAPLRIVKNKEGLHILQPKTGLDFTNQMRRWAKTFLDALPLVDGFITKAKSPSCGLFDTNVYPSIQKAMPIAKGPGFFGAMVLARFSDLAVEDERRLLNPRIRDHFLKKLFALASFRELTRSGSIESLVPFQAENKLLLTAYSQKELRSLGRLVANRKGIPQDQLFHEYFVHLLAAFKRPPRPGSNINIALKSFGYFSKKLDPAEKTCFLETLNQYRTGLITFSVLTALLKAWFVRFKEEYLLSQTFYSPYPDKLVDLDKQHVTS